MYWIQEPHLLVVLSASSFVFLTLLGGSLISCFPCVASDAHLALALRLSLQETAACLGHHLGTVVLQGSYLEIKKQMDKLDPLAHPLLQWYGWADSSSQGQDGQEGGWT